MALQNWVFIYTAPGLEESGRTTVVETRECRTLLVGVPNVDAGVRFAATLDDSVQMIELCGGFGPKGTARVIEATQGRVPVGAVVYGPESVDGVHAIFSR